MKTMQPSQALRPACGSVLRCPGFALPVAWFGLPIFAWWHQQPSRTHWLRIVHSVPLDQEHTQHKQIRLGTKDQTSPHADKAFISTQGLC